MDKKEIIIIILSTFLALSLGFIIFQNVKTTGNTISGENTELIEKKAVALGYQLATLEIFQKAAECKKVPIYVDNYTLNLIALECAQKPK